MADTRIGFWQKFLRPELDYQPGKYVPQFDACRGIGIIFVLLAHAFRERFLISWIFLDMFFVLSGFLITGILLDTRGTKGYLKNFISRRILRVFPIYYVFLAVLFYLIPDSVLDLSYYREKQGWFWTYTQNWLFSREGFPAERAMHHFWSLAVEEQFYIFWPFVVLLLPRRGMIFFCTVLILLSLWFRNYGTEFGFVPPFYYVATLSRMEGLALGAICAILIREKPFILERIAPYALTISTALSIALFAYAGSFDFLHPVNYSITYTVVDVFFSAAIVYALAGGQFGWLNRLLTDRRLIWFGMISYGLYIFHYPILQISLNSFQDFLTFYVRKPALAKLLCVVLAYSCTIALAYLSFRYFESPVLRLKRYFTPKKNPADLVEAR